MIRHVRSLDRQLAELPVPYEEWETLYRMRLQLERDALVEIGDSETPDSRAGGATPEVRKASRLDLAIALAGGALIALDLALLVSNRLRKRPGK